MSDKLYKMTLYAPEELVILAKKQALDERLSMSGLVRGLLEQWVSGKIETPQSAKDEGKDTLSNQNVAGLVAN